MIRSESKRSFCGAGKNNKMATAVRLHRRREVAALFISHDPSTQPHTLSSYS